MEWSPPLITRLLRKARQPYWHYRKVARYGEALMSQLASPNAPSMIDLWKGDASIGQRVTGGENPADIFGADWHHFVWLRDMREFGGKHARVEARNLILSWVKYHKSWDNVTWHPVTIAYRLRALILTWNWCGQSAPKDQQIEILTHLMLLSHYLHKDWRRLNNSDDQFLAITALLLDQGFREGNQTSSPMLEERLNTLLAEMILPDGCHASREPHRHLKCLMLLHEARQAISMIHHDDPDSASVLPHLKTLDDLISQMGSVGRMWRMGDKGLSSIRGGLDIAPDLADQILDKSGHNGKVTQHSIDGGFIRLARGRSVAVMNTAPPASSINGLVAVGGFSDAGANGIEFSVQNQRLIIHGGQSDLVSRTYPDLAKLLKGTAAFSTLSIDMTNSANVDVVAEDARIAHNTTAEIGPAYGGLLGVSSHDGYVNLYSVIHERKIFLANGGNALKGEDMIHYTNGPGSIPREAIIRFHLHPGITANLSRKGTVLMKLLGNLASWQFVAEDGEISLDDSITVLSGKPQKCQQIVVTLPLINLRQHQTLSARWGFFKVARVSKKTAEIR